MVLLIKVADDKKKRQDMTEGVVTIYSTNVVLLRGDITKQDTDAIVNAANSSLLGGGGVDGAIHRAGGPKILEECKEIRAKFKQEGCKPGEAVITTAGNLKARFVIHTVGPVYRGGTCNESKILASAYNNSLLVAVAHDLKTIAFPSISTGAYGYPKEEAAKIAINTIASFCASSSAISEIRFVLFDKLTFDAFSNALSQILSP